MSVFSGGNESFIAAVMLRKHCVCVRVNRSVASSRSGLCKLLTSGCLLLFPLRHRRTCSRSVVVSGSFVILCLIEKFSLSATTRGT